ncbi:hypothetical protein H2201_006833 [Coniosporium apollinis]|uniref:Shugoshin C-terminal domain-containing protein n=1 Tax=Coniosporium apollinis TaxID=61459 RepID=A0ABQ9NL64_9PEZI|nr:hypothetical protein H2201_006833 [Coniosporium apollinis]
MPVSDKKPPSTTRPGSAASAASTKSLSSGSKSSPTDGPVKGVARVVKKEDPPSPSDRKSEAKKQASTSSSNPISQPAEAKPRRPTVSGDTERPSKQPLASARSEEKESLIVKLKYGKKNRLLIKNAEVDKHNAKPRLKEEASSSPSPSSSPSTVDRPKKNDTPIQKERAQPPKEALKKHAEKSQSATARPERAEKPLRPRDDDSAIAPPSKRQKPPSSLDLDKEPSTPAQPAFPSPALSNPSSAQKAQHLAPTSQPTTTSQHLTPKKDHRVAMMRSNSNDSLNNSTPKPSGVSSSAPQSTITNPAPTSAPAARAPDIQLLLSRSRHLNDLGRRLKHATTAILSKTSPPPRARPLPR